MGWRTQGFPGSGDQQPWGDDALDAASGQFSPDDLDSFDGFESFDGAAEPAPEAPGTT